jgi:hypothetical protein
MIDFDLTLEPDPSRPGCALGVTALQRLLDGEADWDSPEAVAHRAACVVCREELILSRSLVQMPDPIVVPADLANRVVSSAIVARRRGRIIQRAGLVTALAASVLVVVVLARPNQQVDLRPGPVALIPAPKSAELPTKPIGESVSEARDAIVSLTKRTAAETRDRSVQLVPNAKLPEGPGADDRLDVLADARVGASKSVEPMRDSARRAFNFILRAADPPARPNAQ